MTQDERGFYIHCGHCKVQVVVPNGKAEGKAILRGDGWRKHEKRGWQCPNCKGAKP